METTRLLFLVLYLAVDIAYVLSSKRVYETVVKKIQGSGFPGDRLADALSAYVILGAGWYFIAAPLVKHWMDQGYSPMVAGAISGFLYGLVLYGVYNFTLRAQFKNYDMSITVRDLVWGTTCGTVITAAYGYFAYQRK